MTAIDPFASVRQTAPTQKKVDTATDNGMGEDTFLKLLVAQLKYQDPMKPTDGTAFIAQTAQFTMVQKLQAIEDQNKVAGNTNQLLAAASMIGRSVTFDAGVNATTPVATAHITVGGTVPATAAIGTRVTATTNAFNAAGTPLPLQLELTQTADAGVWDLRAYANGQQLGNPTRVTFDADGELTSGDVTIPSDALDQIGDTAGTWAAGGITIALGTPGEAGRLHAAGGTGHISVLEQNGSDGKTFTGIVSGFHVDADGAHLRVGDHDVLLADITEVHAT